MTKLQNTKSFLHKHKALIILSFFLTILLLALPACKESTGDVISTQNDDNVSVGFYAENEGGDNTMSITEAKFLLKKLVLKMENSDNEKDLKIGPFIVNLNLMQKVDLIAINKISPANYDAVKFFVHKPAPNDVIPDPDFTESNNNRYSVVVKGFYNGVPYIYKSDVTVHKKINIENSVITVDAPPAVNITIRVNPYSWFDENGTVLDPANEHNRHKIDHNIKESLKRAFKDMNFDGFPD